MTTEPQIAVEPVTDEDYAAACATAFLLGLRPVLEQDRRRVADRQKGRTTEMAEWVGIAAEIERLRAEVARLSAACAAKDEALRLLTDMDELRETDELYIARAALSDTAGKGWIDASGAVEATCFSHCEIIGREPFGTYRDVGRVEVPKDWADDEVLIVRKPK